MRFSRRIMPPTVPPHIKIAMRQARYTVDEKVQRRGGGYSVKARYYRQSLHQVVYTLKELDRPFGAVVEGVPEWQIRKFPPPGVNLR